MKGVKFCNHLAQLFAQNFDIVQYMKGDFDFMSGTRCKGYADIMAFHPGVTGSNTLLVVKYDDGTSIKGCLDIGLYQEKEFLQLNSKLHFNPETLDFVLITHNHIDHTGRLPLLTKNGYRGNIYTTNETKQLIKLALYDSYKVLKNLAMRNNEKPLYYEEDVNVALSKIVGCSYEEEIPLTPNVKATFLSNGHLQGAAMIWLHITKEGYEDIDILITGDYNNKNMFFDVSPIPNEIKKLPLTIIQESTYGNMDSSEITECFESNVTSAIKQGKIVLVPVFSLGRAQEILYVIKKLQKLGKISTSIPIYFDGKLAFKYTDIYLNGTLNIKEDMKDFLPENLTYVDDSMRPDIIANNDSKIILTTSGMGSYGPAQTYIPQLLSKENVLIQFTGYTADGTLGSRLKNTPKGNKVDVAGLAVIKRADVEYTTEYSAHAKADEMIEFLQQFENLKMVLLNHGEPEVKEKFAERILKEVNTKYVGILGNGYLFRIGPYGLIKTMGMKFE